MKNRWIVHSDKRIFIADYSELDKKLNTLRSEVAVERGCATMIADVWQDVVGFDKALGWSAPRVVLLRHRFDRAEE